MGSRGATTVHRDTRSAGDTCYPALYLDASSVPCAPHPAAVGGDVLCRKRRSIGSAYVFHPKRRANKVVPATTSLIAFFPGSRRRTPPGYAQRVHHRQGVPVDR